MCNWGEDVPLRVLITAHDSHNGKTRWAEKGIDRCIAPIIQALNDAGVYTVGCCCGHGKDDGYIKLLDGRLLVIKHDEPLYDRLKTLAQPNTANICE